MFIYKINWKPKCNIDRATIQTTPPTIIINHNHKFYMALTHQNKLSNFNFFCKIYKIQLIFLKVNLL